MITYPADCASWCFPQDDILFTFRIVWYNATEIYQIQKGATRIVTTEERKQLRDYELTVIINPEYSEEKFETTLDNISQFITDRGGTVVDIDRWGKRRLAYPIKHFIEGNYVLAKIQIGSTLGKELEANLQISGDVLRHLLIKLNN